MPVIHHHHSHNYTKVPNKILKDSRLSLADIGLLVYMLSLPKDWEFSVVGLSAILPHDGKDKIASIVKRLKSYGYIQQNVLRYNGKYMDTEWIVSDTPMDNTAQIPKQAENPSTEKKLNYYEYMASEAWGEKRFQRMKADGFKCARCGSESSLQVHHLTYERLGHEDMDDLITLCKSCHAKSHKKVKPRKENTHDIQ